MLSTKVLNVCLTVSCFVGLAFSIYAYVVEQAAEKDENYIAFCDINEYVSCTKVFKTEYAKGFGLFAMVFGEDSIMNKPNSLSGMAYYSLIIILTQINSKPPALLVHVASVGSILLSIYLAYLLIFVIRTLCLVCVGTYIVNFINLICSHYKYKSLCVPMSVGKAKKKKA